MDALTFAATIVKAIIWPAIAAYALWLFRSNLPSALNNLLARLTSAKAAGLELNFGKRLDEAEEVLPPLSQILTAKGITAQTEIRNATVTVDESASTAEEAERLFNAYEIGIGLPPPYIVTQAWLRFEEEIQLYLKFRGVGPEGLHRSASFTLRSLGNDGVFSADELSQLSELRTLRNRVAHQTDVSVTRTDALRYNDIINGLIERLRSKRLSS